MNPPDTVNVVENASLVRYSINLKTERIFGYSLPIEVKSELYQYVNHLDFPTINEAYRGKKVNNYLKLLSMMASIYFFSIVSSMV